MVEQSPSVENETIDESVAGDDGQIATRGLSAVLLRARHQADVLIQKSAAGEDLNGEVAASQQIVAQPSEEL